jgi:hypothetical protein
MATMPTLICFSGLGGDGITVEETPELVLQGLSRSSGDPLLLTRNGDHKGVYVIPSRIACWYPSAGDNADPPMVPRPFKGPI